MNKDTRPSEAAPSAALSDQVNWQLNMWMLWFSQLLIFAGFSALIPFIPLFIRDSLGVADEKALVTYVTMFNFFGTGAYAVFNPIWGTLSDRWGVRPMLFRGTFATAFIFPLMGYVSNVWLLILLRFISAACAGTTAASQMMIARNTPDDKQGFALGVLTTSIWGGSVLGNVLGGMIIHFYQSYTAVFWLCGIMYFISGFAIIFTRDTPIRRKEVKPLYFTIHLPQSVYCMLPNAMNSFLLHLHIKAALAEEAKEEEKLQETGTERKEKKKHPWTAYLPHLSLVVWLLLLLFVLMGISRNYTAPYLALKVATYTKDAAYWTGIVSAVVCGGAIFSGVIMGYLSDRISPNYLMLPVLFLSAAALALQGAASSILAFTVYRVFQNIIAGGIHPVLQKVLSAVTPKRSRGTAFGFASCASSIGAMLSALMGGGSIWLFSLNGVFYMAALFTAVIIPVFFLIFNMAMRSPMYATKQNAVKKA
ncbi:MAG: MFS transporter [Lentisphaeria bacterium]|nr:MFS transporter [Lentisphaeria bacterium]